MAGTPRIYPSPSELANAAADEVIRRVCAGVEARGRFALVLSGGSTPLALYRRLAERANDPTVPWGAVEWFWGDERPVPPDHPESNFGAAWEALLSKLPIPNARLHRIEGELAPEPAAVRYEAEIRRVFALGPAERPRFDLVLLGLGTDGHTASLFPGSPALAETERLVVANRVEKLDSHRITLTYPALNAARTVLFLVAGAEKEEVLKQVLERPRQLERLPAQGVAPTAGELLWWVDREAARQLASADTTARVRQPRR